VQEAKALADIYLHFILPYYLLKKESRALHRLGMLGSDPGLVGGQT
jgi:hypothetical protein